LARSARAARSASGSANSTGRWPTLPPPVWPAALCHHLSRLEVNCTQLIPHDVFKIRSPATSAPVFAPNVGYDGPSRYPARGSASPHSDIFVPCFTSSFQR
jgi:hypothetical protein